MKGLKNYKRALTGTLIGVSTIGIADILANAQNKVGWVALGITGGMLSTTAVSVMVNNAVSEKIADKLKIEDNEEMNEIRRKKIYNNVEKVTGATIAGLSIAGCALMHEMTRENVIGNMATYSLGVGGMLSGMSQLTTGDRLPYDEAKKYEDYKAEQKQLRKEQKQLGKQKN